MYTQLRLAQNSCTVIHLYGLDYTQKQFELRMKTWHNVLAKAKLVCVKFGLSGLPSCHEGV